MDTVTPRMKSSPRHRQRGAALVVGMIMLAILTLLAITAMNTSSTELVMAGNEQFRERAFQIAETGIEQAVRDLSLTGQNPDKPRDVTGVKSISLPDDKYTTRSTYVGKDDGPPNYSVNKFVGLQYMIDSTGTSVRNATVVLRQGAYQPDPIGQGNEPTPYLNGAPAP